MRPSTEKRVSCSLFIIWKQREEKESVYQHHQIKLIAHFYLSNKSGHKNLCFIKKGEVIQFSGKGEKKKLIAILCFFVSKSWIEGIVLLDNNTHVSNS